MYTQKSGSKLKLRFHGHTRAGAAHFLALMHEVDLMPSWNAFVPWASVLEGSSDHDELVAGLLELQSTDFRRESDLGRFMPGADPYLVR